MFKKLLNKKDNKGFTLVELIIVIAILAILVGLLAPQYTKYVEKSRKAADASNIDNLVQGVKIAAADVDYAAMIPTTGTISYKFTITSGKASLAVTNGTDAAKKAVCDALKEYTGYDFTSDVALKLKSKSWASPNEITAEVKVDENGAVTVDYEPNTLETYLDKSTTVASSSAAE